MKKIILNNRLFLLFIILPLLIIPFLQTNLLLDTSLHIRLLALNIWLLFISIFFIFIRKKLSFVVNKFLIIYLCYILYSLISLFISPNTADAVFHFVMITDLGLLVLFYFIIFYTFPFKIQDIAFVFNILALVVLILTYNDYFRIISSTEPMHQAIYNVKASFSHKNILSEVLFVLFPFSLYFLFVEKKWYRVIGFINSIGILFLLIVLLTRAVWIAVIVGFMVSILAYILISGKKKVVILFQKKRTYLFIFSFVFVVISSVFIYTKLDSFETLKKSTEKIFKAYDSSQHRIELWKRSIDITKESPIIGKGLGTWRIEVLKFGNRNLQSEDNVTFYQRPHNDFLWILSEQGIIGLLFFLSLFAIIFYYLIKIIKITASENLTIFYYLLFYLLIGYLIFSFFSFPRERIEHNLFLGIVLGLIIAKYYHFRGSKPNLYIKTNYSIFVFVFITFFLLFCTKVAYTRFNSESHIRKAFEARSMGNWAQVIKEINKSESYFYKIDPFSTPIRWYSGEAYFKLGNTDLAFTEFKKSFVMNPYHIHVLNNLATSYEIKGNHEMAIDLYNRAIIISPKFDEALLNLSAVYYNNGNIDSASSIISRVDSLSKNEKYLPFLEIILKKKIENIIKSTDNKLITDLLIKINNDNDWILKIFRKSKKNCITFANQLLIDCIYVLKNIDKTISETEYNEFKTNIL